MDLRQLTTFHRVATLLSFTKAAADLNYAQSSVTAQVKSLEVALGVELFERLRGRIRLTPAGERLLPYAERILSLVDEARDKTTGWAEPAGLLTIGTSESLTSYRMPPVLEFLHHRYPRLRISPRTGSADRTRDALRQGALDMGFFMDARTEHAGLSTETLWSEPLVAVAAPGHRLAGLPGPTSGDLAAVPLLVPEAEDCCRELLEAELATGATAGPGPESGPGPELLEFGTVESVKRGVAAGLGVSVLPRVAVADALATGGLVVLDWRPPFELHTQIAWRHGRQVTREMRAFIDQIVRFAAQDGPDGAYAQGAAYGQDRTYGQGTSRAPAPPVVSEVSDTPDGFAVRTGRSGLQLVG
ncbi:LysR family transcriptional regulator [Streptomyces sp. NPDC048717]|uniref:LysR family transcriptional regulator n=1 Tax=Streptomyces sp. NPDC048717 TaxID=3154928 RepID=UPI00341DB9DB